MTVPAVFALKSRAGDARVMHRISPSRTRRTVTSSSWGEVRLHAADAEKVGPKLLDARARYEPKLYANFEFLYEEMGGHDGDAQRTS